LVGGNYFSYVYFKGPWANTKGRYLGLKFVIKGEEHYGWARLNVKIVVITIVATLTGYAYETIPRKPIIAGQTKAPDEAGSEPPNASLTPPRSRAGLGLLGLGSSGLSIWRRDETVGAMQ
jgi:hypothetical protein